MVITFVTSTLTSGGAERVISILANEFCQRGHDVEMIALTSISDDFYKLDKKISFVHADKECRGGLLKEIIWFRRRIKKQKPDVVIAFMEAVYEFVLFSLLGTGIPVISSERKDPATLSLFRKFLRWLLLPTAAAHVVQTKKIKSFYRNSIQKKTHVIYNPVNEQAYQLQGMDRENRIISVGRLYPQKNQKIMIEAFAKICDRFPDWKLVIYGEGFLRKDLENLIDKVNVRKKVFLPGRKESVINEIAKSKVFCLSSDYEGMSNAMIEAFCVGTPVISTKVSGTDELIRDGVNGLLVDIGDTEALAQVFEKILGNQELREQIGKQGKGLSNKFKTDVIVEQWEKLIQLVKN